MPLVPRHPRREPEPLSGRDPFAANCSCGLARTPLLTNDAAGLPRRIWRACTVCDLSLRFPVVSG